MILVKNPVLGGSRCPPPGGIGGTLIIYDHTTKCTGVDRSDPPQAPWKLGPGLPIFKYIHLLHVLLHITTIGAKSIDAYQKLDTFFE
jgi:hypothetical protein